MKNNNNQQFKQVTFLFRKYKLDSDINQTLSSQRFSSINPQIKLLPRIQPIQTQSQPNSPVKIKSPNVNYPTITTTKMQIALIEQMHQTIRQKHFVQFSNTRNQKKQDNFSQTTLDEAKLLQYLD
ncbi:unnamed protein product [Paramecium sonneborni]|uniref:Uncharacterized protein n=1 Tax=Paramecium sonneborni TaxID=65129 RepID=A0A8S1P5X7_9CILI|nr:unnamed protein product [Paramecium sonneborni]